MSTFKEVFEKIYGEGSFNEDFTISATAAQNIFVQVIRARENRVYVGELTGKYEWAPEMKWQQLKEYANSLNEEQLSEKVIVWGEERGFGIQEAAGLEEDYYIDDYSAVPVSCFEADETDEDDKLENYTILKKGTPRLHTDVFLISEDKN